MRGHPPAARLLQVFQTLIARFVRVLSMENVIGEPVGRGALSNRIGERRIVRYKLHTCLVSGRLHVGALVGAEVGQDGLHDLPGNVPCLLFTVCGILIPGEAGFRQHRHKETQTKFVMEFHEGKRRFDSLGIVYAKPTGQPARRGPLSQPPPRCRRRFISGRGGKTQREADCGTGAGRLLCKHFAALQGREIFDDLQARGGINVALPIHRKLFQRLR